MSKSKMYLLFFTAAHAFGSHPQAPAQDARHQPEQPREPGDAPGDEVVSTG